MVNIVVQHLALIEKGTAGNNEDDNNYSLSEQPVHDVSYMPDCLMRSLHQGVLNSKENSGEEFLMCCSLCLTILSL